MNCDSKLNIPYSASRVQENPQQTKLKKTKQVAGKTFMMIIIILTSMLTVNYQLDVTTLQIKRIRSTASAILKANSTMVLCLMPRQNGYSYVPSRTGSSLEIIQPSSTATKPMRHSVLELAVHKAPATLHSIPRTRNIQQSPCASNLACKAQAQPKHPIRLHKLQHKQLSPARSDAGVLSCARRSPHSPCPVPPAGTQRALGPLRGRLRIQAPSGRCSPPGRAQRAGQCPPALLPTLPRTSSAEDAGTAGHTPPGSGKARRGPAPQPRPCPGPSGPRSGGGRGRSAR